MLNAPVLVRSLKLTIWCVEGKVQIDQLYPNVKPVRLNGHTDEYPSLRYEGVRFKSVEELARAVDVCFLAATDIEFDSVVRTLNTQEKLPSTSLDVKRIIVGHRRDTLAMVLVRSLKLSSIEPC